MTIIFALFFLLLGFIGGIILTCDITLNMLHNCAEKNIPFISKFYITIKGENCQQE